MGCDPLKIKAFHNISKHPLHTYTFASQTCLTEERDGNNIVPNARTKHTPFFAANKSVFVSWRVCQNVQTFLLAYTQSLRAGCLCNVAFVSAFEKQADDERVFLVARRGEKRRQECSGNVDEFGVGWEGKGV